MALISLEDAKAYLRVDTADEDAMIGTLITSAGRLCADVARLTQEQWDDLDSGKVRSARYTDSQIQAARDIMKIAILYTVGYLFEHREEADHHALALTLRAILSGMREGVV